MTRSGLILVFSLILLSMLAVTSYAAFDRSIFKVGPELLSDPWFHATLADAYFGFLTFYVWVAYKEPGWWRKLLWFLLIMTLGNIAMAIYMLIQLASFEKTAGLQSILLRKEQATTPSP